MSCTIACTSACPEPGAKVLAGTSCSIISASRPARAPTSRGSRAAATCGFSGSGFTSISAIRVTRSGARFNISIATSAPSQCPATAKRGGAWSSTARAISSTDVSAPRLATCTGRTADTVMIWCQKARASIISPGISSSGSGPEAGGVGPIIAVRPLQNSGP